MYAVQMFVCEACAEPFRNKDMAEICESSHAKIRLSIPRYGKLLRYPESISLHFDGSMMSYEYKLQGIDEDLNRQLFKEAWDKGIAKLDLRSEIMGDMSNQMAQCQNETEAA